MREGEEVCVASGEWLRAELGASLVSAGNALAAADRLCHACVDLLGVDGAAVSVMHDGSTQGACSARTSAR